MDAEGAGVELVPYTEDEAATPSKKQTAAEKPPVMVKVQEKYVVKRGSFKQVVDSLEAYKNAGITTYD